MFEVLTATRQIIQYQMQALEQQRSALEETNPTEPAHRLLKVKTAEQLGNILAEMMLCYDQLYELEEMQADPTQIYELYAEGKERCA